MKKELYNFYIEFETSRKELVYTKIILLINYRRNDFF